MKKHIIIGSIICLATLLIFLVFWGKLPAEVPIHFDSAGNVNSTLPNANVNHFFTLLGKMFFTPYGKEFFSYSGKQIFTS